MLDVILVHGAVLGRQVQHAAVGDETTQALGDARVYAVESRSDNQAILLTENALALFF